MKTPILFLSLVLISSQAFAFNWKECRQQAANIASKNHTKGGAGSNPVTDFFLDTMCASTSSTTTSTFGFTSSTSKCGAFAMREQREEFMRANLYDVKMDVAKGHGDYLNSLASLSGCEGDAALSRFGGTLRQNFKRVFPQSGDGAIAPMTQQIDQLIQEDEVLVHSCVLAG